MNRPLSDVDVLASVSEGFAQLAGERNALDAVDAETELWDRPELGRGGMLWAAGGDPAELRRRLAVMVRRPELTHRQRALVSILQGRARRMLGP